MKLSGEKAVFFEPLAKNRDSTPIEWIPQDGDEDDESFFQRVTSSQHECGYTYRQQGRSRLGRRLPEGTKPPNVERVRIWEARGIPPTWTTGSLSKWLVANIWTEVDFISQPTKLRAACSEPNLLRMPCVLLTKAAKVTASEFLNIFTAPKQTPIRAAGKSLDVSANQNSIWHAINGSKGAPAKPASKTAEPKEPEAMTVSDQKAIKSILLIATLMKL